MSEKKLFVIVIVIVIFNGGRVVMLQKWSLMEGEWSCYSSGH